MKAPKISGLVVLLLSLTVCFLWLKWKHDGPRRYCLQTLQNLRASIDSNSSAILDVIVLPQALAGRTSAEQTEFLDKALRDEISAEGVATLKRQGTFGALKALFPQEAEGWAKMAGVNPYDCVAFKMERDGIRAEVVLLHKGETYRVLRCNNVKQMAGEVRHS